MEVPEFRPSHCRVCWAASLFQLADWEVGEKDTGEGSRERGWSQPEDAWGQGEGGWRSGQFFQGCHGRVSLQGNHNEVSPHRLLQLLLWVVRCCWAGRVEGVRSSALTGADSSLGLYADAARQESIHWLAPRLKTGR